MVRCCGCLVTSLLVARRWIGDGVRLWLTLFVWVASMSVASAASTIYECEVQSTTGALGSILVSVHLIGIDEAEQAIDFFADSDLVDRPHHTMGRLADLSFFYSDLSSVTATFNGIYRVEAFTLHLKDESTWLATHSFTVPEGVAAVTWQCQLES
jgi:hypothetical protein